MEHASQPSPRGRLAEKPFAQSQHKPVVRVVFSIVADSREGSWYHRFRNIPSLSGIRVRVPEFRVQIARYRIGRVQKSSRSAKSHLKEQQHPGKQREVLGMIYN